MQKGVSTCSQTVAHKIIKLRNASREIINLAISQMWGVYDKPGWPALPTYAYWTHLPVVTSTPLSNYWIVRFGTECNGYSRRQLCLTVHITLTRQTAQPSGSADRAALSRPTQRCTAPPGSFSRPPADCGRMKGCSLPPSRSVADIAWQAHQRASSTQTLFCAIARWNTAPAAKERSQT